MVDVDTSKHDFVEAISRLCGNNFFAEVVTYTDLHGRWTSTELMLHPESETKVEAAKRPLAEGWRLVGPRCYAAAVAAGRTYIAAARGGCFYSLASEWLYC